MFANTDFALFTALLALAEGSLSLKFASDASEGRMHRAPSQKTKFPPKVPSPSHHISYTYCTSDEQRDIASAIRVAQDYATMSYNHLKSNPSGSKLYTRWFGTFRHDLYTVVLERFSRLREEPATWEYHCDCYGRGVLASTDSREPGLIKPCPAFWQAPATGIGSKAAVIIQEGTRWDYRSGTLNFARGEQKSLALAGANPFKAAYNSDYAYFAIDAYKEKA